MADILLEICCGSADDVYQAAAAGADRVELNAGMFLGGLTPSIGEVKVARGAGIPIMAMVRPRQGGFCYTQREFETALADAEALLAAGAEGLVFGFLLPDGRLDVYRSRKFLQAVGDVPTVFHRAIDVTPNWRDALDTLAELGVTRVLTSGQAPSVHYGMDTVRAMIERAAGRIEIMPGAGITVQNAREIIEKTGCSQIHVMLSEPHADTSTAHNAAIYYGGALYPPEDRFEIASREQIQTLKAHI